MPGVWKGTRKTKHEKKHQMIYVYMYSIFLLLDKRMCSSIANECIRIPCIYQQLEDTIPPTFKDSVQAKSFKAFSLSNHCRDLISHGDLG